MVKRMFISCRYGRGGGADTIHTWCAQSPDLVLLSRLQEVGQQEVYQQHRLLRITDVTTDPERAKVQSVNLNVYTATACCKSRALGGLILSYDTQDKV